MNYHRRATPVPGISNRSMLSGTKHSSSWTFESEIDQRAAIMDSRNLLSNMSRVDLLTAARLAGLEERRQLVETAAIRNNARIEHMLSSLRGTIASFVTQPSLFGEGITIPIPPQPRERLYNGVLNQEASAWKGVSTMSSGPLGFQHQCDTRLQEQFQGVSFPTKLFVMLDNAEAEGYSDIISFLQNGEAFMIHKSDEFAQVVLPRFFKTSRLTSFQKQLSLYGFNRVKHGPEVGAIRHEHFRRDNQKLVAKIHRQKRVRAQDDESDERAPKRTHVDEGAANTPPETEWEGGATKTIAVEVTKEGT